MVDTTRRRDSGGDGVEVEMAWGQRRLCRSVAKVVMREAAVSEVERKEARNA